MKKFIILVCMIAINTSTNAQILTRLKEKIKNTTEQKIEQKVDHKVESTVDSVLEGNIHLPKKESRNKIDSSDVIKLSDKKETLPKAKFDTNYISKFDFIPGEEIVVIENFKDDAIGDFPAKWNTSGSGEIVSIEGLEGKWLLMQNQSNFTFNDLLSLPENFTVQFEIMITLPFEWRNEPIYFALGDIKNPGNYINTSHYSLNDNRNITFWLNLHPSMGSSDFSGYGGYLMNNTSTSNLVNEKLDLKNYFMDTKDKLPLKVAIWKQKQRLRVYLNENKILDLPKILPSGTNVNTLVWQTLSLQGENKYFIGNIRVAVGNPDTRNKLLTEGKLISNGILFSVNSDIIKPESYGTIKEIAGVLIENRGLNIKIVGHTDSDGDETSNLDLSLKRAIAVKNILSQEFKIDKSRLETEGKGENEPIVPDTNSINKAKNRRVEFIKII